MPYNVVLHANGNTYGTFGPYRSKKDAQTDARALRTRLNPDAKATVVQVRKEAAKRLLDDDFSNRQKKRHHNFRGAVYPYIVVALTSDGRGNDWKVAGSYSTLKELKDHRRHKVPPSHTLLVFKDGKRAGDFMEIGFYAPGSPTYRKHKVPKRPNGKVKDFLQSLGRGAKRGAKLTYEYGKEAAQAGGETIAEGGRRTAEAAKVAKAHAKIADMERAAKILGLSDVGVKLKDLPRYQHQTHEAQKVAGDVRVARQKRSRALTDKRQKRAGSRKKRLAANPSYRGVKLVVDESGMTRLTDPISGKRVSFDRESGGREAAQSFIDRRLGR